MKLIKIQGREGYEKLHNLPFNRQFAVRPELTESIKKHGFINPILLVETDVVDGKMKTWIADGQNRALSASFLDVEFYGVVSQQKFKDIGELVAFVAQLNSTQKPWYCIDYAQAFNYLGFEEYHKLLVVKNTYTYSVETMASMLASRQIGARQGAPKLIKDGKFKATFFDEVHKTMQIAGVLSKHKKITSRMLLALHQVRSEEGFVDEVFIKNFNDNYERVWNEKEDRHLALFRSFIKK